MTTMRIFPPTILKLAGVLLGRAEAAFQIRGSNAFDLSDVPEGEREGIKRLALASLTGQDPDDIKTEDLGDLTIGEDWLLARAVSKIIGALAEQTMIAIPADAGRQAEIAQKLAEARAQGPGPMMLVEDPIGLGPDGEPVQGPGEPATITEAAYQAEHNPDDDVRADGTLTPEAEARKLENEVPPLTREQARDALAQLEPDSDGTEDPRP